MLERIGQGGQGLRHRRAADDDQARRGLHGLTLTIENRALRPGANLYLVTTPAGLAVAGNVGSLATRRW